MDDADSRAALRHRPWWAFALLVGSVVVGFLSSLTGYYHGCPLVAAEIAPSHSNAELWVRTVGYAIIVLGYVPYLVSLAALYWLLFSVTPSRLTIAGLIALTTGLLATYARGGVDVLFQSWPVESVYRSGCPEFLFGDGERDRYSTRVVAAREGPSFKAVLTRRAARIHR